MSKGITDQEFIDAWKKLKSANKVAEHLGISVRNAYQRRVDLQKRYDILLSSDAINAHYVKVKDYVSRATAQLDNGVIMVASDCHYFPGVVSSAHKAFVKLIKQIKPDFIVMNGDVFDGATVSRYPRQHWGATKPPTVKQELEAVSDRLHEIEKAAANAKLIWTLGNHDQRFESRLVSAAPEYEGVAGFSLKEHFPRWIHCMSLMVNGNMMIKHRYRSSVHATYLNTLHSGVSIVTGHLHRLQATIFSDYKGTRWGVDTGTLADTNGEHMGYGEDDPKNHCSGFAVLTIVDGQLIQPELCAVMDDVAYFRGKAV